MSFYQEQARQAAKADIFEAGGHILDDSAQRYFETHLSEIHEAKITADTEKNVYLRPPREQMEKAETRRKDLLKEITDKVSAKQEDENKKRAQQQKAITEAEKIYKKEFLPAAEKLLSAFSKAQNILKAAKVPDYQNPMPSPRLEGVTGAYDVECDTESMINMLETVTAKIKTKR